MKASKKTENEFVKIIDQYKLIIIKVANMYTGDRTKREDLIQEITFQLWKTFKNFNKSKKITTWIYRVALNTSISFLRKENTRKKGMDDFKLVNTIFQYEDPIIEERLTKLRLSINQLKSFEKAIIIMHLDGNNNKEISEIMGITTSNVSTRLNRIKNSLKKQLNPQNS